MFRRSRFSIRPNVGTAGRTAATPQEAPPVNQKAGETPKDVSESNTATAVTENKSVVTPSENPIAQGDGNDQNGEGTNSSAAVQRRKRFSVKPKVAPGRPSILARTAKSPVKAVSETPVEVPDADLDKPTTTSQTATTAAPQGLQSPRRRRPSEESKQPKAQPKPTLVPSDSSGPSVVAPAEDLLNETHLSADCSKQLENTSGSQMKEVPFRVPNKVPPSLPDKEAIEISEKAKTLVSSKSGLSQSPAAFSLSRLLNDPLDLQRLAKARKLRELLKEEIHKEKKIKKSKSRAKEFTLDPAKMTMRDLIHYLPVSNPMTTSLEDPAPQNETVVPPSPVREDSPERAQEPEVPPEVASPREEEEEEAAAEEEQEEAFLVPQVKVAEDGSLIIDEESLTVEVQRAKGPNPAQDRDPIFERGSTTTYSSFRKGTYSKPWSSEETDMFFLAISMVGTDFSMICQLFPHRARSEIKNKFKKEERENAWRIDKAFRERRKLDIEYFSKLLEKILEVQKNRKKLKSLAEKNSPKKNKGKAKGKKAARKLSDVEEEEENEIPHLEEGEKENEDLCNEGGTSVSKPKKKRKRKNEQDASTEEANDKKNKTDEKSSEQDEAYIPEDAEAALPEDRANSDISEKTENLNASKDTAIKPTKLSRGRAPKPLLQLGRKLGKKPPPPSTKTKDTASDKVDESVNDGATEEQVNKDASPIRQGNQRKSASDDISSEEEDATVQPPRPTRYGRMPKPTKPLTYAAKDDKHSSASETTPASPAGSTASATNHKPKCTAKRRRSSKPQSVQESKKPKLVTLRASQSEYSDDEENEKQWEEVEEEQHPACSSSRDSSAAAFVPASLRSPHPVIAEVEETMEELDILVNMPDVLGISQDALCPDVTCKLAQNETGLAEPCEHQLDLLVDVIDCLSSEYTVSEDESYNEAAHTLLTIGNLAHLSQSAQNQTAIQDHTTVAVTTTVSVDETSQNLEEDIASKPAAQEENSDTPLMSATSGQGVTEMSETVATVELQNSTTNDGDKPITVTSDQRTGPTPQLQSSPERSDKISLQTRRGRLSKVKPKPNLAQASRTIQPKSQPETSTGMAAVESHTVAPNLSQATESLSATEETPKKADCSQKWSTDKISFIGVTLPEDASGSQERYVDQITSGAATSDQSTSENQSYCLSGTRLEPSLEQATRESTDEILMSEVGTTKSSCNNLVTSDTAVTELQRTNIYSPPIQQSSDHPAPSVTPVKDLPVSQKEKSKDASTHQTRKSGFQKVKPKPNLTKTSRTAHSKPQTAKDSNLTPNPMQKFHEKPIVAVEAESTCITSPEKPDESISPASDLIPSLDVGSALTTIEELSTTQEKSTDVGVVSQVQSGAATSDQSASENRFVPEATRDTSPTSESTEEKTMSCVGAIETSIEPGSNTDSAPVQESSDHSAPCITHVEELSVSQKEESKFASTHPTGRSRFQKVKPKPNITLTSRTVRSKPITTKDTIEKNSNPTPNPKIHEKTIVEVEAEPPWITSPEKLSQSTGPGSDLIPSLDVSSTLKPTEELSTSEEKKTDVGVVGQVESSTATSDQSASENQNFSEAQFEPSREQATRDSSPTSESTEEKPIPHIGTFESYCSNLPTSDLAIQEKVGPESNTYSDSAPIQESSDHPASCIPYVEELPVSQHEESEVASTCQTRKGKKFKPKPNLPRTSRTVQSKPQTTKVPVTHMQLVEKPSSPTSRPVSSDNSVAEIEAWPSCSTTPPGKPSQIKSAGTASLSVPLLELCSTHKPAEELSSTEGQRTDVGSAQVSSSEGSENNVPQRRQRFSKVKPNLGSYTRNKPTKMQPNDCSKPSELHHMDTSSNVTSEQQPVNNNDAQTQLQPAEKDSEHLTSTHCSLQTELISSTKLGPAESEKSVDNPTDKGTNSNGVVIATSLVAENLPVLTDSVVENKSSEKATVEGESTGDMVAAGLASQSDCKQDMPVRVTETNTQLTDDPTAILDVQSLEDGSTESKMKSANAQSTYNPKESIQQPCSENASEVQSQDAVQQSSEATETNPTAAQSTYDNESEPPNSSNSSRKALQTHRGRLAKPKPNLGPCRRPQQIPKITQAKADSVTPSEGLDVSMSHKPVSEGQPHIHEPVEGAIEQHSNQNSPLNNAASPFGCLTQVVEQLSQHDSPQNVAGSSLGCLTQVTDNSTQDGSSPSTGGNQSQPNLTIFSDMLSEQVPSDPDEQFFILSLTEIPVCSLGEMVDSTSEPLPCLPVADASVQQQSVPGEGLAAAGDEPLPNFAVPVSTEETVETGLINIKDIVPDPAAYKGSIMGNPVDPHESTTVQPSVLPETVENNEETERPPTKQRLRSAPKTAKLQAKPKTPRKKQASKTLAAKETESTPTHVSELPGPSVEPKTLDEVVTESKKGSGDHADIKKEIWKEGWKDPEDSAGAQTTQTRRTSSRRKPKGSTSSSETNNTAPSSDSPPGKAASKGPKVKTPRTVGKRSTPAPVASTSYDVAPTPTQTQSSKETHLNPSVDMEQTSKHSRLFSNPTRSTSPCTAEFSAFQQSDSEGSSSKQEGEPTSVSQYFLSDIFTEVEEG